MIKLENTNSSKKDRRKNIKSESSSDTNKIKKERRDRLFDKFKCEDCGKIFESATIFKQHSLDQHGNNRPFGCSQCDKKYLDQRNLDIHIRKIHNKEVNHICKQCKRPFFDKREWKRHTKNCVATYWLIACPICDDAQFQAHTQWRQRTLHFPYTTCNECV